MRSTFKVFLLLAVLLFVLSLACRLPGGSTPSESESLQSTIYVQQTQLAEKENPASEGLQSTAGPDGGLPLTDSEGQLVNPDTGSGSQGDFEFLGQIGGSSYAVAADGGTAFVGEGPRLVALDVSNPAAPTRIGQSEMLPGLVLGVQLVGEYAYVAARYGGLHIFDVSDPAHPALLSSIQPKSASCNAVAVQGDLAYLACNPSGLFIVDISSPQSPIEVSSQKVPGTMLSIAVVGQYAYLVDGTNQQGLVAVDVSDPGNPEKTGTFTVMDVPDPQHENYSFYSVRACGNHLCLAAVQDGLVVLDLSNPAVPAYAGRYDTQVASGLAVDGDVVYLVDDMDGLHVVDISNPARPEQTGTMPTTVGGFEFSVQQTAERGVFVQGKTLYISDQAYGLTVVDVSQPDSPKRVGHYETPVPDSLFGIKVQGDYAYVIGDTSGFRVVNIADPARMAEVSHDNSRKDLYLQAPNALVVEGNRAYISDANYPFHVYDISNPADPVQTGAVFDHEASDGAYDLAVAGETAYLAGWGGNDAFYPGNGLWAVDISNPDEPEPVGFVDVPNKLWSLAASGSTLYALDGLVDDKDSAPLSLRVFDLSNPHQPVEAGSVVMQGMMPGMLSGILVHGNHLYANLMMPMGVKSFDISDPVKPVEISGLPMSFSGSPGMVQAGNYLFVGGTIVYDVSNAAQPTMVGAAPGVVGAWDCDVVGDRVYIIAPMQGLYVYRFKPLS